MLDKTLLAFYHVATEKNFRRASENLNTSQPSVTRLIQKFENQLKVKLFMRDKSKVSLTPEGETLLKKVSLITDTYNDIQSTFKTEKDQLSGEINFLTSAGLASEWLPDILSAFALKYREITLNIIATDHDVGMIERGFDVALLPFQKESTALTQREIISFELGLFASPSYLKEFGVPRDLQDLDDHKLIAFSEWGRHLFGNINSHLCVGRDMASPRSPVFSSSSGISIARACHQGVGIAFLPKQAPYLENLNLVPVLKDLEFPNISGHLIHQTRLKNTKRIKVFCQFLEEAMQKMVSPGDPQGNARAYPGQDAHYLRAAL